MYALKSIRYEELGRYNITLQSGNDRMVSTTAIIVFDRKNNDILGVNFNTNDIGEIIMKEYFDTKKLCAAILAFHKASQI